jgi:hypothetical protein
MQPTRDARMAIVRQTVANATNALVRAFRVDADLFAASVAVGALVDIYRRSLRGFNVIKICRFRRITIALALVSIELKPNSTHALEAASIVHTDVITARGSHLALVLIWY